MKTPAIPFKYVSLKCILDNDIRWLQNPIISSTNYVDIHYVTNTPGLKGTIFLIDALHTYMYDLKGGLMLKHLNN